MGRIVACFVVLFVVASLNAQTHECDSALSQGVFNVLKFDMRKSAEDNFLSWLKTADVGSAKSAQKLGLDVLIPVDGVPVDVGLTWNNIDDNSWNKQKQKLLKHNWKTEEVVSLFQSTVDQGLIQAWLGCIKETSNARGLRAEAWASDNDTIVATFQFAMQGVSQTTVIWPTPANARLIGTAPDTKLNALTPRTLTYRRIDSTKPVILVFSTPQGDAFAVVPGNPPPPAAKRQLSLMVNSVTYTKFVAENQNNLIDGRAQFRIQVVALDANGKELAKAESTSQNEMILDVRPTQPHGLLKSKVTLSQPLSIEIDPACDSVKVYGICDVPLGPPAYSITPFEIINIRQPTIAVGERTKTFSFANTIGANQATAVEGEASYTILSLK